MSDAPLLIVGAGIGGLSLAAGLARTGRPFRVFEQAPALAEVGAGLGLWTNAIRALHTLGVDTVDLAPRGSEVRFGEVGNAEGRTLARFDVGAIARALGAPSLVVHRGELHATIARHLDPAAVTLDARLVGLEQDAEGVTLTFEDGSTARGAIAVGADGLRSRVRTELFGDAPPRYAGETCYRGVAPVELAGDEAERKARCDGIVRQSRSFGRVGGWSHPVAVALRELSNRATPGFVLERVMRRQIGYDAGPLA